MRNTTITESPITDPVMPLDKVLLEKLLTSTTKQLFQYLPKKLTSYGYNSITVNNDNYLYATGNIPIMLVAHIDTVFDKQPTKTQLVYNSNTISSKHKNNGIGADDRAGIYSILQIIEYNSKRSITDTMHNSRPYILFTTDEEIGGLGAKVAARELNPDIKYIIELDRKGNNDAVFYDCQNIEFIEYIESFNFNYAYGSFSDISVLCPAWNVAGVNLSIGYYNQHTSKEYLNISEMNNIIERVKFMINNLPENKFTYFVYNSEQNILDEDEEMIYNNNDDEELSYYLHQLYFKK